MPKPKDKYFHENCLAEMAIKKFLISICDIDFFNFHDRQVQKFKILKLSEQNKILWSNLEITNRESKSQQSTQMNEIE
jgi:hypothetical protein